MNNEGGCLAIAIIVARIAAWLVAGILSWNWVHPESFGGAIGFLIVWGILGSVLYYVVGAIIIAIFGGFNN